MSKPFERLEAQRLRREEGLPMKQIAARLGVSPGSVHLWTRDISLTREQQSRNLRSANEIRAVAWVERHRARRAKHQLEGRVRAREGRPLHHAGCMLYWAEGAKDRNTLCFANSDPAMVAFFGRFLKEEMDVRAEDFKVSLNVYTGNGLSVVDIEERWLRVLGAPRSCLRGHVLNHYPTSTSGRKKNRLPYGVCDLRASKSTPIVQHIFGAIQEYGGFNEPRWLG